MSSRTDERIRAAYQRLAADAVGGAVTVTRICGEAGVSRASYYRSRVAAEISKAMQQADQPGSRTNQLTGEVRRPQRGERELRAAHATEVRELRETIAAYANQVQALALRNVELEDEANRLREKLVQEQLSGVRPLRSV